MVQHKGVVAIAAIDVVVGRDGCSTAANANNVAGGVVTVAVHDVRYEVRLLEERVQGLAAIVDIVADVVVDAEEPFVQHRWQWHRDNGHGGGDGRRRRRRRDIGAAFVSSTSFGWTDVVVDVVTDNRTA